VAPNGHAGFYTAKTHSRPSLEVTSLWLRGLDQMLAEKRNYIGVKLLVEANAIKAWRVAT
jgi:hypothetical protein